MNQPPLQDGAAVPMLVLTRQQDNVEAINQALRRAGHAVHCTWLPNARDLADAVIQINPELLVVFSDEGLLPLEAVRELRSRTQPPIPVILVSATVDEATMITALRAGAQEVVTLASIERLQLVCGRELRAYRLERALNSTLSTARESQRALAAFLEGSKDAITQVQEGIVVDVNPAWLELFGHADADALRGQPLMDLFEQDSHTALKGALAACQQGQWSDHALRVNALLTDGSQLPLELVLTVGEFDGEPAVRLSVAARRHDEVEMQRRLDEAVRTDPATGLLHRRFLIEAIGARLKEPIKGGVRYLALLRPDRTEQIVERVGPLLVEEFIAQFALVVREQSQPAIVAGRFSSSGVLLLIERGTARDVEAWAEHVVKKLAAHVFKVANHSLTATATIGLAPVAANNPDPAAPVAEAFAAVRKGRELGGNRYYAADRSGADTRTVANDKVWVRHLKSALMENRFRLVQQPIVSLLGEDKGMYDVLVRMLDEHGKEVLPSEFLPAAERNDLMKNIDRWVIGAAMAYCASRRPAALFVRLSKDTVNDQTLSLWIGNQLKATRIEPLQLVFQVPQEIPNAYLLQTKELRADLKRRGFRFAIERFGAGTDPAQLIEHLKPEFVKIDGALMQGLATNSTRQQQVKNLVSIAKAAGAATVAERVEDANTMAVLWQLGIEYIQGYFVHKPEDVVLG